MWEETKIDTWLLKQYSTIFERYKEKNSVENKEVVTKVINAIKRQEQKLNGQAFNEDDETLLNILVYIYRYIFWKQAKNWLTKRVREIKKLLEDLIFILERNQEKINKYVMQWAQSELKISILGKEVKWKAIDLEEKNQEKLYYCYYLLDELEIINSIVDWLEQVTDNIFNNKLYYEKITNILNQLSSFTLSIEEKTIMWEDGKQDWDENKTQDWNEEEKQWKPKKITLSSSIKEIYIETNSKFSEFIATFKKTKQFDMNIKTVIEYMNRYMKFKKEVLELYYNKLYNNITEIDMSFEFYINKQHN